ncbi:MAG: tannase/feruloyl esterase family alpha/beta hydrolase, partial [Alphaproteobacteria bacterium]|nr:tannase/feruloyl esterase family alpha/beta hydrolase [Alphaproteobacteria bacterium]
MNHCGGGPATDQFDALSAITNWAEAGKAPNRIVAHGMAFPKTTRPLCPYPRYARYRAGDVKDANSFVCKTGDVRHGR